MTLGRGKPLSVMSSIIHLHIAFPPCLCYIEI